MPELPEVETTKRGIAPHLLQRQIVQLTVRDRRLRWPITDELIAGAANMQVTSVERRAKYLLIGGDSPAGGGTLIGHLGMSGSLRLLPTDEAPGKHDHVDFLLDSGKLLRFTDPRRFGSWHWVAGTTDPCSHKLLAALGPEPLSDEFNGDLLYTASRGKTVAVKNFVMNNHVVVGVGNIYASESLFVAGINPKRAAGKVSRERYRLLAGAIKKVLAASIEQGGTTLRDFTGAGGQPGYFKQKLRVYEREGEGCLRCDGVIQRAVIGQRASYFCSLCQR